MSQNFGAVPAHWDGGVADPGTTTCVIIPNFVALGQTISAYVGAQKLETPRPRHIGAGTWLTP